MPWKNYNPKLAMPNHYKYLSDWGRVIPTSDEIAWTTNPKHNWVYNKLQVAISQNLPAGPTGTDPTTYPVIIKPITNLHGGGVGAVLCHNEQQYQEYKSLAGYFWSKYLFGTHYSTDLIVVNGEIMFDVSFIGEKLQLGLFDYWKLAPTNKNTLHKLQAWVTNNLATYTGCLNVETLDDYIIEAHLRMGDIDRLGDTGLLEAIHVLYNANRWVYTDSIPDEFYISALFGQHNKQFSINSTLANFLFKSLVYFQLDQSNVEEMGKPVKGQRLALFCDHSLNKTIDARNIAIALFNPEIDGSFVQPLTGYINLRI